MCVCLHVVIIYMYTICMQIKKIVCNLEFTLFWEVHPMDISEWVSLLSMVQIC